MKKPAVEANQEDLNMDITQSFPTKYLSKNDFIQPKLLIIDTVKMENVAPDNQIVEMKPVLYVNGSPKGIVLNKTNADVLKLLYGSETDNWTGRQIVAYEDVTVKNPQGNVVGGIRLRPNQQAPVDFQQPAPVPAGQQPMAPNSDTRAAENAAQAVQLSLIHI